MLDIEKGLLENKFDGYTKRERVLLDKERQRLERFFGGIRELKGRPDALFIVDPGREGVVVLEAAQVGVPMMALIDSNTDPTKIDLPVPANDDAVRSITAILTKIVEGYNAGKGAAGKTVPVKAEAVKGETVKTGAVKPETVKTESVKAA
jgi:small subunit ribosomal protein S2